MACTPAEFARWLPGATCNAGIETSVAADRTHYRITLGDGAIDISTQTCSPRRIAAISLPVLRVTFRFIDLDPMQRSAFMARFDAYTRRGGG
ncbi:hypothetical protein D3870_20880 [Noviherbaspirillum cavernae]|uniref:Uncharacterized protein n=2 Tax=Noviherbaspirillum cavernae TaxID=2320862 RepID=A0A418WVX4_9BURK|nr:hypothetical protein D3870_20880 [Noviherbaspirillum cavernae]